MNLPDCRFLLNSDPALPGELAVKSSEILNLSAKMGDDGTLRWNRENHGYDPLPWLAVLAGYVVDSREDSNTFLADFRKRTAESERSAGPNRPCSLR